MNYNKWKQQIKTQHDTKYHSNLLKYANDILNEIGRSNQKVVAEELQLKASHLSIIKPMLLAYSEIETAKEEHSDADNR